MTTGAFDAEETNRELSERLEHMERAVIPGFYGSGEGRLGADILTGRFGCDGLHCGQGDSRGYV